MTMLGRILGFGRWVTFGRYAGCNRCDAQWTGEPSDVVGMRCPWCSQGQIVEYTDYRRAWYSLWPVRLARCMILAVGLWGTPIDTPADKRQRTMPFWLALEVAVGLHFEPPEWLMDVIRWRQ